MILCKVVDNFGDIGVVYRLARALSDLRGELELTLVVSNLESFHKMAPQIDPKKSLQDFRYKNSVWKVLDWNLPPEKFKNEDFNSSIILECFQCGRPDWLENILFSPDFTRTVQIIQIDYLTAEEYADDFHLLKSGTRKANIKKIFFMPGFTEKTGGLIINEETGATAVLQSGSTTLTSPKEQPSRFPHFRCRSIPPLPCGRSGTPSAVLQSLAQSDFKILFFAYEDDCTAVVNGISDFQIKMQETNKDFSVLVFLAEGKSSSPFEKAWKESGSPFKIQKIPFLAQEEFDIFISQLDFLFVRGEDSLARAALTALPYAWQAYKQDENYQLVKVNALLERMESYFEPDAFKPIKDFWQSYNDYENPTKKEALTQMLFDAANGKNTDGFLNFAKRLFQNGNLAEHLLHFIDKLNF